MEVDDAEEAEAEEEPRGDAGDNNEGGEDAETADERATDVVGETAKAEGVSVGVRVESSEETAHAASTFSKSFPKRLRRRPRA